MALPESEKTSQKAVVLFVDEQRLEGNAAAPAGRLCGAGDAHAAGGEAADARHVARLGPEARETPGRRQLFARGEEGAEVVYVRREAPANEATFGSRNGDRRL